MALAWGRSQAPAERAPEPHFDFRSPGLDLLADRLSAPGKHEVLDLGSARGANLDFFSEFSCRLHIEDVYWDLADFPEDDPHGDRQAIEQERLRLLDRALHLDASVQVDLVLGWDLFSYLSPLATRGLMERVAQYCRPGTLLFLIVSTNQEMPAQPSRLEFLSERRIRFEPSTTQTVSCPAYPPLSLERMMPGFHLLHSFLLGERMQDYLFSFR